MKVIFINTYEKMYNTKIDINYNITIFYMKKSNFILLSFLYRAYHH